jgi:small redox-active disulfide protein 2
MIIKVLGPGCPDCGRLEDVAWQAVAKLGIDAKVVKVADAAEIMRYGVMATPALVIDDEVKMSGRGPSVEEVARMISRSTR